MKTYEELLDERDAAMREASELAMCIWRSEFRNESPEFELRDSPAGVVTQIDNMFAGIRQQRDALKYHLSRVLSAYGGNSGFEPSLSVFCRAIDEARELIDATPQQCLAEIKAEAGRAGFIAGYHKMHIEFVGSLASSEGAEFAADQYADKIRQGVDL